MASLPAVDHQTEREERYERTAREARRTVESVLAGGQVRLDAELHRLRKLGVIDEHGNRIRTDLPADMQPDSGCDFGG
jgi:hypothetical protein